MIRTALEAFLRRYGYELKISGTPVRGFDAFFHLVRNRGFAPSTVIDVGVGNGTPWLYKAFPEARFVLFEALDVFEPSLRRICAEFDAEYHLCGLGDVAGEATISMPIEIPTGSTILSRTSHLLAAQKGTRSEKTISKSIQIRRLDEFSGFAKPILLKIDVEGSEISVLRGAGELLRDTEMIVCEVGVLPRYEGEADFPELASFLKSEGFVMFDILDMSQRGRDGPLAYMDVAFIKFDSSLRLAWL